MKHREASSAILSTSSPSALASNRGGKRRSRISSCIGALALGLACLAVGAGCSADVSDGPGVESTAAASQTLTKTVDVQGRQVAVDVEFSAAVSADQAQALLDAIQIFDKDAEPSFDASGVYGFAQVSADPSRELSASVPGLAVRLRAQEPGASVGDLAWSWPSDAFPPSAQEGVVLSAEALGAKSSSDVANVYADSAAPGVAPAASVKSKWSWFGTKFYVYLSKKEACTVAKSSTAAAGVIESYVPQPYGTLVAIGITAQVSAIKKNVGSDGVTLHVYGPVSVAPGIIFKVERRGSSSSCG